MNLEIIRGQNFSSNSFILLSDSKEKVVIIDLGLGGKANSFQLKNKLDKITNTDKNFEIEIFLTHCHIDHILGYDNLAFYTNVTYAASKNTTQHINTRDEATLKEVFGRAIIDFTVNRIYADHEHIKIGDKELQVIYTPGHTDGCAVVYDKKSKALFAGDVVFAEGASGRVDLPTSNHQQLVDSLSLLAELDINHLYSGHGLDLHQHVRENILAARAMLKEWY